jgi:Cof subfamily protein (haloacid dehalogenase superfamily)
MDARPTRRARPLASPRPRLLAVDLDGTLLDPKTGRPHARDVAALRALSASGVVVSIVTGRLYSGTRAAAESIGLRGPVACVDGSHVVSAHDHATLAHHAIRGAEARIMRDALARAGAATYLFAKDAIVHDDAGLEYLGYVSTWSTDVRRSDSALEHPFWSDDDGVTAVVAVGTHTQILAAVDGIQRGLADVAQVVMFPIRRLPGTFGLVTRAAGRSKGTALAWLAAHHGYDLDETVCIGDWLNDVPMLAVAGRSYAMGHSPDEVKAAATDVVPETSEDGGGVARVVAEAFGIAVDS